MARIHPPSEHETRSDSTTIKYYSFGGQIIGTLAPGASAGVDDGTGLQYFPSTSSGHRLTDHLGSVVAITDSTGTLISQQRYLPHVPEAIASGMRRSPPACANPSGPSTDLGYTGQRNLDADPSTSSGHRIGLMDYKARFYSAYLNRFVQPDTLIPNPGNPQAFNRYSYVSNRPLNFNDPTGHWECNFDPDECAFLQKHNSGNGIPITLPGGGSISGGGGDDDLEVKLKEDDGGNDLPSVSDLYELGWENFGQAWSIWTNPNASYGQQFLASSYMTYWAGAHLLLAAGMTLLAWEAIIAVGAKLATQNPDGAMVSIGNFSKSATGYIQTGLEKSYTYFSLGRAYGVLDKLGLANPMNQRFMQNQMNQGKDFAATIITKAGPGTQMEMNMLLQNGYTQIASAWTGFSSVFMHPAIQR